MTDFLGENEGLIDQIGCLIATNNLIAGKSCQFVYFKTLQKLIICNPHNCYKFVKKDVGGGSLVLERDIFTQIKFRKQDTAEDYYFIKDCLKDGYKIYSTDPFNYLIFRHQNLDYHTWKVNDSEYISWGSLLPKVKDPKTFVRAGETTNVVADLTKAKKLLNFSVEPGLKEGLRYTYQWFKSQYA